MAKAKMTFHVEVDQTAVDCLYSIQSLLKLFKEHDDIGRSISITLTKDGKTTDTSIQVHATELLVTYSRIIDELSEQLKDYNKSASGGEV